MVSLLSILVSVFSILSVIGIDNEISIIDGFDTLFLSNTVKKKKLLLIWGRSVFLDLHNQGPCFKETLFFTSYLRPFLQKYLKKT